MPALLTVMRTTADLDNLSPAVPERGFTAGLCKMLSWLSPGFPVGAFSFSHGLEAAVQAGVVRDCASLEGRIGAMVVRGSGRIDADILRDAYQASAVADIEALSTANRRGIAFRGAAETRLETTAEGAAFLKTCRAAWPEAFLDRWAEILTKSGEGVCYPAALGAAMARAGIPLECALTGYLQAMAANLISAGLRLGLVGQTNGQRILAALEPVIAAAVGNALDRDTACFGSTTFAVELSSMAHEAQYSRLFRS
jgi:urease accessory protein